MPQGQARKAIEYYKVELLRDRVNMLSCMFTDHFREVLYVLRPLDTRQGGLTQEN